mmetsp:Transcript_53739/g.143795  ORF Transcript_53739/g.143795 Transcript_53739/m.143795 type:complete len:300 (-) Transcript_53739:173-1072(-)
MEDLASAHCEPTCLLKSLRERGHKTWLARSTRDCMHIASNSRAILRVVLEQAADPKMHPGPMCAIFMGGAQGTTSPASAMGLGNIDLFNDLHPNVGHPGPIDSTICMPEMVHKIQGARGGGAATSQERHAARCASGVLTVGPTKDGGGFTKCFQVRSMHIVVAVGARELGAEVVEDYVENVARVLPRVRELSTTRDSHERGARALIDALVHDPFGFGQVILVHEQATPCRKGTNFAVIRARLRQMKRVADATRVASTEPLAVPGLTVRGWDAFVPRPDAHVEFVHALWPRGIFSNDDSR